MEKMQKFACKVKNIVFWMRVREKESETVWVWMGEGVYAIHSQTHLALSSIFSFCLFRFLQDVLPLNWFLALLLVVANILLGKRIHFVWTHFHHLANKSDKLVFFKEDKTISWNTVCKRKADKERNDKSMVIDTWFFPCGFVDDSGSLKTMRELF